MFDLLGGDLKMAVGGGNCSVVGVLRGEGLRFRKLVCGWAGKE